MKFTAQKTVIMDALKKASFCVAKNDTLPILANALFEANAETGDVSISCYNIEQHITVNFPATVEHGGSATIPAKRLRAVLSALSTAPVTFDTDKNFHTVIECGTAKITLLGLPPEDFPEMGIITPETLFTIDSKELQRLIKHAGYAINPADSRKVLHGMLLDLDGETITAVSTDSKRLAVATSQASEPFAEKRQYIIPAMAIAFLNTLQGGKVELLFSQKLAIFKAENVFLTTKLCEGNFPNWKAVIPPNFDNVAKIEPTALLDKLAIMQQVSSEIVSFSITNEDLTLTAATPENGNASDTMAVVSGRGNIDPAVMNFNPAFVVQAVSSCSDNKEMALKFNNAVSPVQFEFADGSFCIIMPIRK